MITQSFLHSVANYTENQIRKVVLNEVYEISEFTVKEVSDNILALNYIIPGADVPHVERIELKDSADQVISTNEVDIPITTDQLMIQMITVGEG